MPHQSGEIIFVDGYLLLDDPTAPPPFYKPGALRPSA